MVAQNLNVGGEQSGNMIFRDFTTNGDGIISALQILRIMRESGRPLSKLKGCLKKYPQALRNLRVRSKPPLEELPDVMELVGETEKKLSGKGRVLLRYSGTEPKIRLLIEGREREEIDRQANRIAAAIESAIGAPAFPGNETGAAVATGARDTCYCCLSPAHYPRRHRSRPRSLGRWRPAKFDGARAGKNQWARRIARPTVIVRDDTLFSGALRTAQSRRTSERGGIAFPCVATGARRGAD